jgi:hypothetical protein
MNDDGDDEWADFAGPSETLNFDKVIVETGDGKRSNLTTATDFDNIRENSSVQTDNDVDTEIFPVSRRGMTVDSSEDATSLATSLATETPLIGKSQELEDDDEWADFEGPTTTAATPIVSTIVPRLLIIPFSILSFDVKIAISSVESFFFLLHFFWAQRRANSKRIVRNQPIST